MTEVILDGRRVTGRRELHALLERELELPDYYGGNLDALLDCLSERGEETLLRLTNTRALEQALGSAYTRALRRVLDRAEEENPRFRWTQEER